MTEQRERAVVVGSTGFGGGITALRWACPTVARMLLPIDRSCTPVPFSPSAAAQPPELAPADITLTRPVAGR
ncbi:hypothetical protein [Streptomyces mirabilis]|uniref:hypothetical protein n=1 Tax=Streptomyces mirabilis TaxID=68239 RepID=UPI0033A32CDF